jgi:hypothetical protein
VLLAIDLTAGAILLAIDLSLFLVGQFATICGAVGANLLVDSLLAVLSASGLSGGHRSILDSVGDAILLVFSALSDFIVAVVSLSGVVLVGVDGLAQIVLLAIDLLVLLRGKFAVVRRAVILDFAVEIGLAGFKVLGLAGGELARLNTIADALQLIFAAIVDRAFFGSLSGLGRGLSGGLALLSERRGRGD